MRVYGGRKLAGFIHRNTAEVVEKKGTEASGGDGGGCGESDRALLSLGSTSSVCLAELMGLAHRDLYFGICVSGTYTGEHLWLTCPAVTLEIRVVTSLNCSLLFLKGRGKAARPYVEPKLINILDVFIGYL